MLVPPGAGALLRAPRVPLGVRAGGRPSPLRSERVTVTAIEAVHDGGEERLPRRARRSASCSPARGGSTSPGTPTSSTAWRPWRGVDLALLPIWGWGPSLGPGHLDPERAARAAALIEPRIVVPIHWGTLYPRFLHRLRPRPLSAPPRRVREVDGGAGASGRRCGCSRRGRVHSRSSRRHARARPSQPRKIRWTRSAPTTSSSGQSRSAGCRTKGNDWVPPSPPWEPTSSSKAATSPACGSKALLIIRSAQCGKASVRRTWSAALGPNGASGSSPSTRSLVEMVRPRAARARRPPPARSARGRIRCPDGGGAPAADRVEGVAAAQARPARARAGS